MKQQIKVICKCCQTEHVLTRSEVGRAFIKLRKTVNSVEHQRKAGVLGAQKRWAK